jgi:hypothetical protein
MLLMPPVRQIVSPNYTPVAIKHQLIVLHMMEGGYLGSIAWLCRVLTQASAHLCLRADGIDMTQLVPLMYKAWAQCAFNGLGVSLEIEGFTAKGLSDVTLNAAALVAARLCLAYGIPPVWARGGQGAGVCCHHDLGAAGGGHVDICGVGDATWLRMMTAIQNAYAALKALPSLPSFALHGLPGPAEVEATPDVDATPSHNGAPRNEPGDLVAHPTLSQFPLHSVAALQSDLNTVVGSSLLVDGRFGKKTESVLRSFQITRGISGEWWAGPASWAALDAAMAKAA